MGVNHYCSNFAIITGINILTGIKALGWLGGLEATSILVVNT